MIGFFLFLLLLCWPIIYFTKLHNKEKHERDNTRLDESENFPRSSRTCYKAPISDPTPSQKVNQTITAITPTKPLESKPTRHNDTVSSPITSKPISSISSKEQPSAKQLRKTSSSKPPLVGTEEGYEYLYYDRNVRWLIHFTFIENLHSILKYGICSRIKSQQLGIPVKYNDSSCASSHDISTSIEFPNDRMLNRKRADNPDLIFVILCISVEVLKVTEYTAYSTNSRTKWGAFKVDQLTALYQEGADRAGLKKKFPSDSQAEICIKDWIPPDYIKGVYFRSQVERELAGDLPDDLMVHVQKEVFWYRNRYLEWYKKQYPNRSDIYG